MSIRWCGTSFLSLSEGFAEPISSPLYTCQWSALMISPLILFAS
nr:hypothetical protein Iba_chr03cCG12660 [Ipomoea batatas]